MCTFCFSLYWPPICQPCIAVHMVISIEGLYWVFWIYRAKQGKKTKTKAVGGQSCQSGPTATYLVYCRLGRKRVGGGGLTTGFIGQPVIGLWAMAWSWSDRVNGTTRVPWKLSTSVVFPGSIKNRRNWRNLILSFTFWISQIFFPLCCKSYILDNGSSDTLSCE